MKKYLSIGEVSKLKNVTIETLRHYDRIGLLKPSYTNPKNSYRFYDINQLFKIDVINHYKKLNISLKDMMEIFDKSNNNEFEKFLSIQKEIIHDKIDYLNQVSSFITRLENKLELNKKLCSINGIHFREIEEREIIYLSYSGATVGDESILIYSKLHNMISNLNMVNLYQGGFIYNIDNGNLKTKIIFDRVLDSSINPKIVKTTLPFGKYICLNYDYEDMELAKNTFLNYIHEKNLNTEFIIDTYMSNEFFDNSKVHRQLQMLVEK